jgi:hypothetical protein
MKHSLAIKAGALFAITSTLASPQLALGQCYFAVTITHDDLGIEVRCASSNTAVCPECYQQFSEPANPVRCKYEDAGNRCGGTECAPAQVNVTIHYRNGTCHEPGTGPLPSNSSYYCYQEGEWHQMPGGTCDNDSTTGTCGSCPG